MDMDRLGAIKKDCLKTVLGLHKMAGSGHIGSSLSCLDILVYLFFERMSPEDKFILSKGHGASALYTVLAKSGRMPEECLATYYQDGTVLAAHPPCKSSLKEIVFGTGSLGHGLSLAAGMALSSRYTGRKRAVFCVLSDGDCNEGSTWEAVMFAAHRKLDNLTVIVDQNLIQGFGRTEDVLDLEPMPDKWRAFNFKVAVAEDGNDFGSLDSAFRELRADGTARPGCIIAKTKKGSGVSFMEDRMEWHYLPMSEEQYINAVKEAEG